MSESEFDIYLKWKINIDPPHSPKKVLALYKTQLADMKISNVSTIKCVEYLALRGYTIPLETVRRWYRDNCKTDDAANAILRSDPVTAKNYRTDATAAVETATNTTGTIDQLYGTVTQQTSSASLSIEQEQERLRLFHMNEETNQKKLAEKNRVIAISKAALKKLADTSPDSVIDRVDSLLNQQNK